jgi:hypothetical protein
VLLPLLLTNPHVNQQRQQQVLRLAAPSAARGASSPLGAGPACLTSCSAAAAAHLRHRHQHRMHRLLLLLLLLKVLLAVLLCVKASVMQGQPQVHQPPLLLLTGCLVASVLHQSRHSRSSSSRSGGPHRLHPLLLLLLLLLVVQCLPSSPSRLA